MFSSSRPRQAFAVLLVGCLVALVASPALAGSRSLSDEIAPLSEPLQLHPENPRYFLFRGEPTTLVTSAEHYGAMVNLDFDYRPYLKTLQRDRLNQTRIFSGAYVERDGSIPSLGYRNTLAPRPGRFLAPWARSSTPGYANGGNKFDLNRWDPAYFERLKDFVAEAGRRGVVVEVVLFSVYYSETNWGVSPLNAANNINGVGDVGQLQTHDFSDPDLQEVQEALTRKIVSELRDFDNVYFELINEPADARNVDPAWQARIATVIAETEAGLPSQRRHLIAQNIHPRPGGPQTPEEVTVVDPNPAISVLNFHYATPLAVDLNADLGRAIVDDETGADGIGDDPYRRQAWDFMLAGGSGYSHLDWSFTPGYEDGSDVPLNPETPGGGTPALRRQLGYLVDFLDRLPLVDMRPDDTVVESGIPEGTQVQALVFEGREYAVYINGDGVTSLFFRLPAGNYRVRWSDPKTGATLQTTTVRTRGDRALLRAPAYSQDVAFTVTRASCSSYPRCSPGRPGG